MNESDPETKSKNLQIKDLIKAMIGSEPCLFHNNKKNLMPITKIGCDPMEDNDER
jgi:hypothetical protein